MKKPTNPTLKNRISTINNAFVYSIIPSLYYTSEDWKSHLKNLGLEEDQCCYCARKGEAKTLDHFYPLVEKGGISGYITEINNLVPCCHSCNSSKGGKKWKEWFTSDKTKKKL